MAADLDDWVDQPIEVEFVTREVVREEQQTRYTLEGADERGILLGYAYESDLSDYRMLFFSWHRIKRVDLLTPVWPNTDTPEGECSEGVEPHPAGVEAQATTWDPQTRRPTEGVEHDTGNLKEWTTDVEGRPQEVGQRRGLWSKLFGRGS